MSEIEDFKNSVIDNLVISSFPERNKGGQNCGVFSRGIRVSHPSFSFEICCGEYKSQMQNKEFCITVFKLLIDDILK